MLPVAFKLLLVEADTGIVLNQAGRRHTRGQPPFEPTFDSEAEATMAKDGLLRLFPWAEVVIYDGDRSAAFRASDAMRARFEALRSKYLRYRHASPFARVFMKTPVDPWDPNAYADFVLTNRGRSA
jgi:hypothetical protein